MKKTIFLCFCATLFIAGISSCSKTSTPNPNAQFIGTYYGTGTNTTNGGSPVAMLDTIVITASPSNSSGIIINSPSLQYNLQGTVSGNTYTNSTQTIVIAGTPVNIISGSGTLTGNTMTYSFTASLNGNTTVVSAADSK